MVEARQRDNWTHTSAILALTANINRDPKKTKVFQPDDFNPFVAQQRKHEADHVSLEEMKGLFTGKPLKKK